MTTVTFYGSSDDLIEVEGDIAGCDEYNAEHGVFEVAGLRVHVNYEGVWTITVGQIDEDVPVTAENMRLTVDGYTMRLAMEVPVVGAYVSKVGP